MNYGRFFGSGILGLLLVSGALLGGYGISNSEAGGRKQETVSSAEEIDNSAFEISDELRQLFSRYNMFTDRLPRGSDRNAVNWRRSSYRSWLNKFNDTLLSGNHSPYEEYLLLSVMVSLSNALEDFDQSESLLLQMKELGRVTKSWEEQYFDVDVQLAGVRYGRAMASDKREDWISVVNTVDETLKKYDKEFSGWKTDGTNQLYLAGYYAILKEKEASLQHLGRWKEAAETGVALSDFIESLPTEMQIEGRIQLEYILEKAARNYLMAGDVESACEVISGIDMLMFHTRSAGFHATILASDHMLGTPLPGRVKHDFMIAWLQQHEWDEYAPEIIQRLYYNSKHVFYGSPGSHEVFADRIKMLSFVEKILLRPDLLAKADDHVVDNYMEKHQGQLPVDNCDLKPMTAEMYRIAVELYGKLGMQDQAEFYAELLVSEFPNYSWTAEAQRILHDKDRKQRQYSSAAVDPVSHDDMVMSSRWDKDNLVLTIDLKPSEKYLLVLDPLRIALLGDVPLAVLKDTTEISVSIFRDDRDMKFPQSFEPEIVTRKINWESGERYFSGNVLVPYVDEINKRAGHILNIRFHVPDEAALKDVVNRCAGSWDVDCNGVVDENDINIVQQFNNGIRDEDSPLFSIVDNCYVVPPDFLHSLSEHVQGYADGG